MSKKIATDRDLWRRVYQRYMIDAVPLGEIANELGYAQDNTIRDVAHKFGLPARRNHWLYNDLAKQMLTDRQEQILLGSLLGDGYLNHRADRNSQFQETHTVYQLEYLNWKQKEMYPFVDKVTIGHKKTQAQFRSKALPQLNFYRNVFYPNGKKIIPVEVLGWLDNLAVAVWYMDDGSITTKDATIRLATCNFHISNVGMLQGWLVAKYGILSYIRLTHGKYPVLAIQHQSNDKFLSIVEPHVIPSMRYKLGQ